MLDVEDLTLHYGQSQILHGIDLHAPVGEVTAVMGTNGVGKTSLLKAISGRHPYSGGRLSVDGQVLDHPTAFAAARAGIAYVPQGREIFPLMSVQENLETAFACLPKEDRAVPDEIFRLFPVLLDMKARRGGDLSGGQQQRIVIAMALMSKPALLILDEPTEGIQPNIVAEIGDIIRKLNREIGLTVILVEQKLPFARKVADRFTILDRGRNVATGDIHELNDKIIQQYLTV